MTPLIYEHPLNEKTRNYLRLEHLAQQIETCLQHDQGNHCFYSLFALCELIDRCDYRSDIIKDIDKQIAYLSMLHASPSVDQQQVLRYMNQLSQHKDRLYHNPRVGQQLTQDKFLAALKQRINIPGASCSFDLPQLHYWLAQPWEHRAQQLKQWYRQLSAIVEPLKLLLYLQRAGAEFINSTAEASFFQGESARNLSIVRVQVAQSADYYPTISGHKNRFAIHFIHFEQQQHSNQTITFKLATCP